MGITFPENTWYNKIVVSRIIRFAYLPPEGNTTPTAGTPQFTPTMTFTTGFNASVCPVKNVPGVPARIDIYFSK